MDEASAHAGNKLQLALTAALLALSVVLGGGQGWLGETVLQFLALALLAWLCVNTIARGNAGPRPTAPHWLILAVIALPLLHLSIRPLGAERALLGILPFAAIYLSSIMLSPGQRTRMLELVLILALGSLVLGMMQLAGGEDSPLYFYSRTNRGEAVGFFANRNHLATLLMMTVPVSLAFATLAVGERTSRGHGGLLAIVARVSLAILLILGLALTRSRAGLVLGMLALLLAWPMVWSLRRRRASRRAFGLIVSVALLLAVQFAFYGILLRLQADPLSDQRWHVARVTAEAAQNGPPLGTGLGSFRQVFQAHDIQAPSAEIVNHAHNDYLELWLEAGWPAIALAGALLVYVAWAGVSAWRRSGNSEDIWAKAATIAIVMVLLHSVVDYPLRTISIQAVLGLLLAVMLSGLRPAARAPGQDRARVSRSDPQPQTAEGIH